MLAVEEEVLEIAVVVLVVLVAVVLVVVLDVCLAITAVQTLVEEVAVVAHLAPTIHTNYLMLVEETVALAS
jgi:hypothetical protein